MFGVAMRMSKKSMIAIAALGVLAVLAASVVPAFIRARSTPSAAPCVNNLLQMQGAKQSWALDNGKSTNDTPVWDDIRPFLKPTLKCPQGGTYILGRVGEAPKCSIGGPSHTVPQ
jgi:hypothetical protein